MTPEIKNIEVLAYQNNEMPENLDIAEQMLFLSLRVLYQSYRNGIITDKVAKRVKASILKSYEKYKLWNDIAKETAGMRNRLGNYLIDINKNGCEKCKKAVAIFTFMDRK